MVVHVKASSSLRAEQAARTRRRIVDAAAEVLVEQGFAGARVEDIADRAGVAVPTVYKAFTNKRNLLVTAVDSAMTDRGQAAVADQPWFTEQLDEPDPEQQLRLIARNARHLYERAGPLLGVLRSAAPLDDELATAWEAVHQQRVQRSQRSARALLAKAGDRALMSREDTALTLLTLTAPDLFTMYTAGRSGVRYERWLAEVLVRSLLAVSRTA
jgi:AcrR family transcriptional regulator